jgi:RNA polymerase sigma factor (sigma-70 family)
MREIKERSANYVNDLYGDHIDLSNEDKIKILEEVNLYMEVTTFELDKQRKDVIKSMFDNSMDIPEDILNGIEWMVNSHYKMIISISNATRRAYQNSVSVDDLIYYGIYGIYRGVLNFNPDRTEGDINIASYFNQWITVYVSKGANQIRNAIRVPKARIAKGARTSIFSIDSYGTGSGESNDPDNLHDILADADDGETENGSEIFISEDMLYVLESSLKPKEIELVKKMFGIGCDEQSIKEIAKEREVTVQMVYSQRKDILTKLRHAMKYIQ